MPGFDLVATMELVTEVVLVTDAGGGVSFREGQLVTSVVACKKKYFNNNYLIQKKIRETKITNYGKIPSKEIEIKFILVLRPVPQVVFSMAIQKKIFCY